jgi:hypothetical protein
MQENLGRRAVCAIVYLLTLQSVTLLAYLNKQPSQGHPAPLCRPSRPSPAPPSTSTCPPSSPPPSPSSPPSSARPTGRSASRPSPPSTPSPPTTAPSWSLRGLTLSSGSCQASSATRTCRWQPLRCRCARACWRNSRRRPGGRCGTRCSRRPSCWCAARCCRGRRSR